MNVHFRTATSYARCSEGDSNWRKQGDYQSVRHLPLVTCHRCLELVIADGERAVQRIIELDQASDT